MRILTPFVSGMLMAETMTALYDYAPSIEFANVTDDRYGAWKAIAERWTEEDDLMIVEQDNVITSGTVPSFKMCPMPWCVFPYQTQCGKPGELPLIIYGLGTTRFRKELMRYVTADEIQSMPGSCGGCNGEPGCWRHTDMKIREAMDRHGFVPHVHWPPGKHLNPNLGVPVGGMVMGPERNKHVSLGGLIA